MFRQRHIGKKDHHSVTSFNCGGTRSINKNKYNRISFSSFFDLWNRRERDIFVSVKSRFHRITAIISFYLSLKKKKRRKLLLVLAADGYVVVNTFLSNIGESADQERKKELIPVLYIFVVFFFGFFL